MSDREALGIFLPRRRILLDTLLVALTLVVASLHFIGAGHDDAWIMLFAGETVGRGLWFLNHNLAVQEISTSVLGALLAALAAVVAPPGAEYVVWKIAAWFPALLAGIFFFRLLLDHCGRWAAMLWLLVLSCFPNWHYWAWGGLESGLFWLATLAFADALSRYSRDPGRANALWLGGVTVLLPLVRADALWALPLALTAGLLARNAGWPVRLLPGGLSCLLTFAFHAARRTFTGHWLPNPAYAKSAPSWDAIRSGFDYLVQFHSDSPLHAAVSVAIPLAAWMSLVLMVRLVSRRGAVPTLLDWAAVIVLLIDLTTVVVGGDWMSFHRFAVRSLPLKLLVLALAAQQFVRPALVRWQFKAVFPALGAAILLLAPTGWISEGVVERSGIYRFPPQLVSSTAGRLPEGILSNFVLANVPAYRDHEVLRPWLEDELPQLVAKAKEAGRLPLKVASYQAGYFARELRRRYAPEAVLFIDLAGLSDSRIGTLLGDRTPLGLMDGTHRWAGTVSGASGVPLADFLRTCPPDVVYVLQVSPVEILLMADAGYSLDYQRTVVINDTVHAATVFTSHLQYGKGCPLLGVE